MQKRSVALCIVLSFVTCGIFSLYWLYCLADDVNYVSGRTGDTPGGMVLLLTIVTCGIYGLYWLYKTGETMDQVRSMHGQMGGHLGILYLLLGLFGFGIISYALMQSELNGYAQY